MGLLDFLFGNTSTDNNYVEVNEDSPFSKIEFERAIRTISVMSYLFRDSTTLRSTGKGRNERMMSTLHSYAGMLGYLYQFEYKLGDYSNIVDSTMASHFTLVTVAMSDESHRKKSIKDLAENWSGILQSVLYLQNDGTYEGNKMKDLQSDIDFVTKVMEKLSGGKCRKPIDHIADGVRPETLHPSYDRYSKMVEEASFNPFNITTRPSLQNTPPLPPEFLDVFSKELNNLFSNPMVRQMGLEQVFSGYVFSMVESYYNNAKYVPKSTVDAIIDMCYQAASNICDISSSIGSLDHIKYKIYYSFLHN